MDSNYDKKTKNLKQQAWQQFQLKQYRSAAKIYLQLAKTYPNDPQFINMLCLALQFIGKTLFALRLMEKTLNLFPNDVSVLINLGAIYIAQNKNDKAITLYENEINKTNPPKTIFKTLFKLYMRKKQYEKILQYANYALKYFANDKTCLTYKGIAFVYLKEYQNGYELLIKQLPDNLNNADFLYYLGVASYNCNKFKEAINFFEQCTRIKPNTACYWSDLGVALKRKINRNLRNEIQCFKKAININPENIYYYHNLANTLIAADKLAITKKILSFVLKKSPDFVDAIISYGYLFHLNGDYEEAKKYYQKAIEINAQAVNAHTNLAFILLIQENLLQGFQTYEWRWKHPDLISITEKFTDVRWQGESLDNKTLLIITEQGYGDTIQFIRYIPLINKGTGNIIVECRPAIFPVLQTVKNIDSVIISQKPYPKHDYYIPLLSLPHLFKTKISTIPHQTPYIQVGKSKNQYWKDYFLPFEKYIKIGIVWSGNPRHKTDHYRSINPSYFNQLNIPQETQLFSLQLDVDANISKQYNFIDLANEIKDFSDTVAIINNLDLIITVDTAVAHFAGALNKPVWIMLGAHHDWRWFTLREKSPWYPSMRLFRQTKRKKWQAVFDKMLIQLKLIERNSTIKKLS